MLRVEQLTKKYGSVTVLNSVSLQVPEGQFVSIVGPSGAGKSTLLHLMGTLDKPDSGKVYMNDISVYDLSMKKQTLWRNRHIGFVFQFHHLLPEFTSMENVAMPLLIAGTNKASALQKAAELLQVVGLQGKENRKPGDMSGGEQQRVAIARSLVTQPSFILADEPTGNLDSNNAQMIHDLLLAMQEKYKPTIIMVTHNEALAARTHRCIHMRDGQIENDVLL